MAQPRSQHPSESEEEDFHGFHPDMTVIGPTKDNKMDLLESKKCEREEILRCLSRQEGFLKSFTEKDVKFVRARIERVRRCWTEFAEVSRAIRSIEGSVVANEALLDEVDERCMVLVSEFEEKLQCAPRAVATPNVDREEQRIRLPPLALPEFSGHYDQWLPFHSLFVSAVHENKVITNTEKIIYLKGALKGEALSVVDSFPTCGSAYEAAWCALNKRYANEYILKKRYVKELLHMPKIRTRKSKEIHHLVESFERNTKLLDQLGECSEKWGVLLIELVLSKLDEETQQKWEQYVEGIDDCSIKSLFEFLRSECRILDATLIDRQTSNSQKGERRAVVNVATKQQTEKCAHCDRLHHIASCKAFLELSAEMRYEAVLKKRLCLNCLVPGHWAAKCFSRARCPVCNKRHHELLHREEKMQEVASEAVSMVASLPSSVPTMSSQVLLSTAVVNVKAKSGKWIAVRALLDNGSQVNIMTSNLQNRLKLEKSSNSVAVSGIGKSDIQNAPLTRTSVASNDKTFCEEIDFIILQKITECQPSNDVKVNFESLPKGLILADPNFDQKGPIDLLLGAEYFAEMLQTKCAKIPASEHHPAFMCTVFGWVAIGRMVSQQGVQVGCHVATVQATFENLAHTIERFWTIEELPEASRVSKQDEDCEASFVQHHFRDDEGRYVVKLPFQVGLQKGLGSSKIAATKRFLQLERRLCRDPSLRKEYCAVMDDYLEKGFMRKVTVDDDTEDHQLHFYLPHHPVIKTSSSSTKVRPVFDGSAKTDTSLSLNDLLLVGPVVQDSLLASMLRFRMKKIALVADIKQMYLQVKVHEDHTPFQRILWRSSPDVPIDVFELQRVTFGLASSSFLATRVLHQLAFDEGDTFPLAKKALLEAFYVDDFIGGANSKEEAIRLQLELSSLLAKGGFHLTKWNSNMKDVLFNVPTADLAQNEERKFEAVEDSIKALGVSWHPETDSLSISSSASPDTNGWTRRRVYSLVAQIFDPLGLVAPVTAWAKILMQALWLATQGWDDPIPSSMEKRWNDFHSQVPLLAEIKVQRYAVVDDPASIQLHCFSDASEAAYGACIYIRSVDANGNGKVTLLAGKSRPAPLKRISVAKLELCGALLAAKLQKTVRDALRLENVETYFWTDSTIVLHWIRAPSYNWVTFVANRVSQIQEMTSGHKWLHVRGAENPADIVSRGALPRDLLLMEEWFHGPPWLVLPVNKWRISRPSNIPDEEMIERRVCAVAAVIDEDGFDWCDRFSSYEKLLRVTAYCLRVLDRRQQKNPRTNRHKCLTLEELRNAKLVLVKRLQQHHFAAELKDLSNGRAVSAKSSIRRLGAFVDDSGLLRVGGRLRSDAMQLEVKHPLLLPKKAKFSKLVTEHYHRISLHGGPTMTLSMMRNEFWPLQGRSLVNSICRSCLQCFKVNPTLIQQPFGRLPAERASPIRPFAVVGVDFAGPVLLKPVHRKAASEKAYICIFVCFSVKAVHIELVESLSTQAFMAAFHRFVSRRGLPSKVYSDNGLNFQGARNSLKELYRMLRSDSAQEDILRYATAAGIEWHFIPPHAPNFGGLWEAAVKSAKRVLLKVLGDRRLSFGDLATVLARIEAQLNSRPLTPLSEDPHELNVLTPGHFLVGTSLNALPEIDVSEAPFATL